MLAGLEIFTRLWVIEIRTCVMALGGNTARGGPSVKGGVKLDQRGGAKVDHFLVKQSFLREGSAGVAGAEACAAVRRRV